MKISQSALKKIIQEELQAISEWEEEEPTDEPEHVETTSLPREDITDMLIDMAERQGIIPRGGDFGQLPTEEVLEIIAHHYYKGKGQ
jgi:hypothetical protein